MRNTQNNALMTCFDGVLSYLTFFAWCDIYKNTGEKLENIANIFQIPSIKKLKKVRREFFWRGKQSEPSFRNVFV